MGGGGGGGGGGGNIYDYVKLGQANLIISFSSNFL